MGLEQQQWAKLKLKFWVFFNCLVKRGQPCKGFLLYLNKIQSFAMVSKVLHYQDYATLSNFIHATLHLAAYTLGVCPPLSVL